MKAGEALRTFLRQSPLARIGFAIVCLLVLLALLAPWISPGKPAAQNLAVRLQGPSFSHWMGTDELGRDILTRILYGARVSLFVSICVVLGCGSIGLTLGMLAGYSGGVFDRIVNLLLINAFLSFPGVLLAIAFAAFFGPGIGKVILALIITGWAGYARLARAGAEDEGTRIRAGSEVAGRFSTAHYDSASFAEHDSTGAGAGHHRHGRSDSGRSDAQLSGFGSARADSQLGRDAERRAKPFI